MWNSFQRISTLLPMISYLAIGFVLFLIATIFYGFSIVMRRPPTSEELENETCSLCRNRFKRSELVERAVGDSKLLFFCGSCIRKLQADFSERSKSPLNS